jgi:hypothetical protein
MGSPLQGMLAGFIEGIDRRGDWLKITIKYAIRDAHAQEYRRFR